MKKSIKTILVFVLAMILICTMLVFVACKDDPTESNKPDDPIVYVEYNITVQRSSGQGFSNATVLLYPEDDPRPYFGTTDSNGVAVITAPKANYTVKFTGITEGYKGDDNYTLLADETNKVFKLNAEVISTPATKDTYYDLGNVMHNFSFTDLYGVKYSLNGLLNQYKAVLLNFWYVGCTWCDYEFPDMIKSYEQYGQDVAVIAFNTEPSEATEQNRYKIYEYVENKGLPFIVADTTDPTTGPLFTSFAFTGNPATVVIDKQGVVCFKIAGALDESTFNELFQRYSAEPYEPYIYFPTEKEHPDVEAPSVEDVASTINGEGMSATYNFEDDEYNWPWVLDGDAITTSNSEKHDSYAIINAKITATTSQCIAFDYKLLTEANQDQFLVIVDGVLIHAYSGDIPEWQTCYAYIPKKDGEYVISLAYVKDETKNPTGDFVSIKNMRYILVDDIKEPTEITYTAASGKPIDASKYSDYITPVYNAEDGYYHVNSEDGPLLLADILNESNWSNNSSAWDFVGNSGLSYDLDGDGVEEDYLDNFTGVAQVANSSERYGLVAVTDDIATLLKILTKKYSNKHENEWLELCSYIEVYGSNSKVEDPAKGLAPYNAYEAFASGDSNEVLNHVVKSRVIMPRGIFYEFIPSETAIYKINSVGNIDTYGWLYDANGRQIAESYEDTSVPGNSNFTFTRVFQEGIAYYIAVDFQFVEDLGEFDFVISKLATEGNVWVNASSGQYHTIVDNDGNLVDVVLGGAVNYALGEDGVYHVKNNDATLGSKIYINLADTTNLFPEISVKSMVDMYCYYCKSCGYVYSGSVSYFESQANPVCVLCTTVGNFEKRGLFELPTPLRNADGQIMVMAFTYEDGNVVYQPLYELNTSEVKDYTDTKTYFNDLATYGIKFTDYTDVISEYVRLSEIEGNYPNEPEVGSSDSHIGYYEATAELVDILNKFIVFGDHGITVSHENIWLMMSCYYKHLG